MQAFFDNLVGELDKVEFLRPAEKRETMLVNLRNIFARMEPTKQDMHTLHGVVMAIAEGRKGPAKGGVLDSAQATRLRALLAEQGTGSAATGNESSSLRGLARLLRRNPTDAERILWQSLTRDRRFAGQFKRQTPVGRQIPDFVSFVQRLAIELVNTNESDAIVRDRAAAARGWPQRGYRVVEIEAAAVETDLARVLDDLAGEDGGGRGAVSAFILRVGVQLGVPVMRRLKVNQNCKLRDRSKSVESNRNFARYLSKAHPRSSKTGQPIHSVTCQQGELALL